MSLNTRLLFALLGFPLLVYATMAVLLVIQSDTEARTALQERLEAASELLAPSLAEALAEDDSQRLETLTHQLLNQKGVRTVGLFNEQGNRVLLAGQTTPPPFTHLPKNNYCWRKTLGDCVYPWVFPATMPINSMPINSMRIRLVQALATLAGWT